MRLSCARFIRIILLGGAISYCASPPDDSAPGHTFEVYIESDVIIARSSGIPKYKGELFTYERAVVLQEDEREESLFVRGDPPYIDERGFFYMTDNSPSDYPSTSCIMVYDPDGIFQFSFGKPGQGPGDMIHPEILQVSNGEIETYDPYQRRFSVYATDGGLLRIVSVSTWKGVGWVQTCYHASDGRYVVPAKRRIPVGDNWNLDQSAVTVFSAEWDTLCTILGEPLYGRPIITRGASYSITGSFTPFGPSPLAAYSNRHGILMTTGKDPVINIHDLDGTYRKQVRIDLQPRSVTAEDCQRFEEPLREQLAESPPALKDRYKARLEALEYSEYMRYWSGLEVDESGFIWIKIPEYVTAPEHGKDAVLYYVLSPEGEYLGTTRLPTYRRGRTRLTKGFLMVVESDRETGEKEIVAYRIRPAVPGFVYP